MKNAPDHRLCQGSACPLGPRAGAAGPPVLRGVLRNSRVVAAVQLLPLCSAILSGMEKNHLGIYLGKTEGKSSPFQLWLSLVVSFASAGLLAKETRGARFDNGVDIHTADKTLGPLPAFHGCSLRHNETKPRSRWQGVMAEMTRAGGTVGLPWLSRENRRNLCRVLRPQGCNDSGLATVLLILCFLTKSRFVAVPSTTEPLERRKGIGC